MNAFKRWGLYPAIGLLFFAAAVAQAEEAQKAPEFVGLLRVRSVNAVFNNVVAFLDTIMPGQGRELQQGLQAITGPDMPPEALPQIAKTPMGAFALLKKEMAGDRPLGILLAEPSALPKDANTPPIAVIVPMDQGRGDLVKIFGMITGSEGKLVDGIHELILEPDAVQSDKLFFKVNPNFVVLAPTKALVQAAVAAYPTGLAVDANALGDLAIEADAGELITRYWPLIKKEIDSEIVELKATLKEMPAEHAERKDMERKISALEWVDRTFPGGLLGLGKTELGLTVDKDKIRLAWRQVAKPGSMVSEIIAACGTIDAKLGQRIPAGSLFSMLYGGNTRVIMALKEFLTPLAQALQLPPKETEQVTKNLGDMEIFSHSMVLTAYASNAGPVFQNVIRLPVGAKPEEVSARIQGAMEIGPAIMKLLKAVIPFPMEMDIKTEPQPEFDHAGLKVSMLKQETKAGQGEMVQTQTGYVAYAVTDGLVLDVTTYDEAACRKGITGLIDAIKGQAPAGGMMADTPDFKAMVAGADQKIMAINVDFVSVMQAMAKIPNNQGAAMMGMMFQNIAGPNPVIRVEARRIPNGFETDAVIPTELIAKIAQAWQKMMMGGPGPGPGPGPVGPAPKIEEF